MKESKYQVLNWKRWKATAILLKETKKELENTTQAISYSNELPTKLLARIIKIKIKKQLRLCIKK